MCMNADVAASADRVDLAPGAGRGRWGAAEAMGKRRPIDYVRDNLSRNYTLLTFTYHDKRHKP